ncbi:uncharacterized protein B0P05DRAFT_543316 [Gilbertella persicaria]|uniref:uncharacterized protein n=1 Tax=Gilbertella persicaria TaxID=101096 RepID=UPI00221F8A12|nr:uncharacterized protein B0P05DRAFT_543316 [Gilbertella persicaria]KAI8077917.1 hypothetical protein B0P05DRAFT_543316 [Gilbertella persicaria]
MQIVAILSVSQVNNLHFLFYIVFIYDALGNLFKDRKHHFPVCAYIIPSCTCVVQLSTHYSVYYF